MCWRKLTPGQGGVRKMDYPRKPGLLSPVGSSTLEYNLPAVCLVLERLYLFLLLRYCQQPACAVGM